MASDHRSQYPYLSEDDLNEYQNDQKQLENLNQFRKKDFEKKIAKFSLSENVSTVEMRPKSNARDELRMVIIGKTGQGKSATANTILGKVRCKEDFTASSVTRESRCFTEVVDGRTISIMDTPGLQDTHQSHESILKELARMTTLFPDGVHAFIYVMNMSDPRFTAEDKHVLELIENTFGGGFKSYCLLVFSHGDSALKDINLDIYKMKQMEIGQETSENRSQHFFSKKKRVPDQDQKSFAKLLGELSWKILAVDNTARKPVEEAHYREQILTMVDKMRILNHPDIYTNERFAQAQQEREAMRQKGLRKGWDPSIMSKVETILAANPSISREELKALVIGQLQEEEEERIQKEKRERQEHLERQEREWKLKQKQQELERQKQIQREDYERQRRAAEEQEKHLRQIQLQNDEWEKRRKEEQEEYNRRQKELWEDQVKAIEEEHRGLLEKAISGIVSVAKTVVGWFF